MKPNTCCSAVPLCAFSSMTTHYTFAYYTLTHSPTPLDAYKMGVQIPDGCLLVQAGRQIEVSRDRGWGVR